LQNLSGKVAFITGGASGIGLGIAMAFLRAGIRVVIADVSRENLDDAARQALKEMINWIVSMTGIHKDEAYAMCSFAGDLHVTQTVNNVKGVHAMLQKGILKK